MTQPASSDGEEKTGIEGALYRTRFAGVRGMPSSLPVSEPAASTGMSQGVEQSVSRRGPFGTQTAPPVDEVLLHGKLDLPVSSAFREVTATHHPGPSELSVLLRIAADQKQNSVSEPVELQNAERPAPPLESSISENRGVGKSTWNLRIHRRDVKGTMPQVEPAAAADAVEYTGLHSAFMDEANAPEYEVLGELAAGNMGVVYHARQLSLNRDLAIKTLKSGSNCTEHDLGMFVSEAVVTANLVHPNIVPIHDLGRTADGQLFYSMKKVVGVPWNKIIRDRSMEDNLEIFMRVCDAVAYAHSRGVVNRDLKPENVIVGDYGEVVVLDWGLAITTERFEKKSSVMVDFRGGCGTPVYMAPELLADSVDLVGPHTDIYLLGAILFEVIEGFPPHLLKRFWNLTNPEDQLNGVISAVLENEIEEDVAHPGELMQVAQKAMATDPPQRFQSVEDFLEAIREYRITGRGEELMRSIDPRTATDYTPFQSAVAIYGEAIRKWPANQRAINGDRIARLAYAELALKRGDIDLGLQVVGGESDRSFLPVISRLKKTRRSRKIVRVTWGLTTAAAVSLAMLCWIFLSKATTALNELADAERTVETIAQRKKELDQSVIDLQKQTEEETAKAVEQTKLAESNAAMAKEQAQLAEAQGELAKENAVRAEQQAQLAEVQAELADKNAVRAEQQAQLAKLASEARNQTEVDGYLIRIRAAQELGHYNDVIQIAEEACENATANKLLEKALPLLIQQIQDAKENGGNAQIPLEGKPGSASISSDGSTVVYVYSAGLTRHVRILRNPGGLHGSQPTPIHLPVTLKNNVRVSVSYDGTCLCLYGKSARQLWQLHNDSYQPLTINGETSGEIQPEFGWAIFSPTGSHLYLIGSDRAATVDVYAVETGTARRLSRLQIASGPGSDYRIRDVVLMPGNKQTSLIAEFESQPCRQYWINWTDPAHLVFEKQANMAPERGPLEAGLLRTFKKATQLCLSPDAKHLAMVGSDTVVVLPRTEDSTHDKFSFATSRNDAEDGSAPAVFQSTFPISDLRFSNDGQRIVTGHGNRYLQVWDREDGRFVPCSAATDLFTHRVARESNQDVTASCLRGHTSDVSEFEFCNGSSDRLISVGLDNSVRTWEISSYNNLVKRVEDFSKEFESVTTPSVPSANMEKSGPDFRLQNNPAVRSVADVRRNILGTYQTTGGPRLAKQANASSPTTSRYQFGRNIYSARFSPNGGQLLVGADDLAAHVIHCGSDVDASNLVRGRRDLFFEPEQNFFTEGHISQVTSVQFLPPDGELLLTADYFGSISAWDARGNKNGVGFERSRLLSEYSFSEFAVSRDGTLVLAGGAVTTVPEASLSDADLKHVGMLWKTEDMLKSPSPAPTMTLENQHVDAAITAVAISDASARLVTAGRRGRIVVWDARDGSVIATAAESHNLDQIAGIFFESESQLVSAGYDGKVFRWTINEDKLLPTEVLRDDQQTLPEFIVRLRPSPDRQRFATSEVVVTTNDEDSKSVQFNVLIWTQHQPPVVLQQEVAMSGDTEKAFRHDIAWSSDGRELMLIQDGNISIFDTTDWKITHRLRPNVAGIRPIRGAFAPASGNSSRQIATIDGRLTHLWDLELKRQLAEFRTHAAYNITASYSADQKFVATASESVRIFNAEELSPGHGRTLYRLTPGEQPRRPLSDVVFSPIHGDYRLVTVDTGGAIEVLNWQPDAEPPLRSTARYPSASEELPSWLTEKELTVGNTAVWCSDGQAVAVIRKGVLSMLRLDDSNPMDVTVPTPDGLECRFNQLDISMQDNLMTAGGVAWNTEQSDLISFGAAWDISGAKPKLIGEFYGEHSVDRYTREPKKADMNHVRRTGITAIAIDGKRKRIITGGADGRLVMWGLSADSTAVLGVINDMRTFGSTTNAHDYSISSIDVATDGKVATADESGALILWVPTRN